MKINGRLLLLAVVTGLFMRLWTSVDRGRVTENAGRSHQSVPAETVVADSQSLQIESAPPVSTVTARGSEVSTVVSEVVSRPVDRDENWTEQSAPIPLPPALTAGSWRVVDDTGRVARLEINRQDEAMIASQDEEFHATQINGRRWYFIRLNSAERIAATVTPPVIRRISVPRVVRHATPTIEIAQAPAPEQPIASREVSPEFLAEIANSRLDLQWAAESAAEETSPVVAEVTEVVEEVSTPIADTATGEQNAAELVTEVPVVAIPVALPDAVATVTEVPAAQPVVTDELQVEEAVEVPDCVVKNRKFDFTGFGDVVPGGETLGDERPAAVDLPEAL
ncbi:MAG: hypothetical protein NT069_08570 [Planctomycetota bacterium]|nr:hypothetical protein [Planctomycetota bacterium]